MPSRSFFFFFALAMAVVYYLTSFSLPMMAGILTGSSLLCAAGIVRGYGSAQGAHRGGLLLLALGMGAFAGLVTHYRIFQDNSNYYRDYTKITAFSGTAYADSRMTASGGVIHFLRLETATAGKSGFRMSAGGRVTVFCQGGEKYYTGRHLRFKGKLETTPGEESHFQSSVSHTSSQPDQQDSYTTPLAALRASLITELSTRINGLGMPAAGLFKALFLGATEELSPGLKLSFQESGTLHLLALSGLHVGILYTLISLLLLPLRNKKIKLVAGGLLLGIYLFLVGPRPSLVRATIMLLLLGINRLLPRPPDALNALALAAVIIIFSDPQAGRSLSFQLSFLALLGIVVAGSKLSRLLAPWVPGFLRLPLACSLGAQFMTAPLVLFHFGTLHPVGIPATLLLTLPLTAFIWTGLFLLIPGVLSLPGIGSTVLFCLHCLYEGIAWTAGFFSAAPALNFSSWYAIFTLGFFIIFLIFPRPRAPWSRKQTNPLKSPPETKAFRA